MFHNYLIMALRNFIRHKLYSFINIAGLTVGLTCAIFIILLCATNSPMIDGFRARKISIAWVYGLSARPAPAPNLDRAVPGARRDAAEIPEVKAIAHLEDRP